MSIRDPFLIDHVAILDRAGAWLMLNAVSFVVLWSGVWERGLHLPWENALQQLYAVFTGTAVPLTRTLFALTITVTVLGTSIVCACLFARWRRKGQLRGQHVRGSRLDE